MSVQLAPAPEYAVAQQPVTGRFTQLMRYWLLSLADRVNATPHVVTTASLSTQSASLPPTDLAIGSLSPGMYRLSIGARITRAATTSSSLTVTLGWTSGVACTAPSAAITGNTTATTGTLSVFVRVDQDSAITYATTYASVGATTMQYALDVSCEQIA